MERKRVILRVKQVTRNNMRIFVAGRPVHGVIRIHDYPHDLCQGYESNETRACLFLILEYLEISKPRIVRIFSCLPPLLRFTDGAVEQGIATASSKN
eukprot:2641385-Amphidinium_carterae.1